MKNQVISTSTKVIMLRIAVVSTVLSIASSLGSSTIGVDRRTVLSTAGSAMVLTPLVSFADEEAIQEVPPATTRLGGLLEKYADVGGRGFRLLRPSSWNQFDGQQGEYDVKWADIVDLASTVVVSSSTYNGDSISGLASVDKLGSKLEKSHGDIISARARSTDGIIFYDYEFKNASPSVHEVLSLCVYKNRLWQVSAKSPEKSWAKREAIFRNSVGSFLPKL